MRVNRIALAAALISMLLSTSAMAQLLGRIFDEEEWTEQQARLPAFPKPESLVLVPMESVRTFEFRIDISSVDVGEDGVIRYAIVARSPNGGENVSFEGIRCNTAERKLYAIGRSSKSWGQAKNAQWLSYRGAGRGYQTELAFRFFCINTLTVRNSAEAVANLKRGGIEREPTGEGD